MRVSAVPAAGAAEFPARCGFRRRGANRSNVPEMETRYGSLIRAPSECRSRPP